MRTRARHAGEVEGSSLARIPRRLEVRLSRRPWNDRVRIAGVESLDREGRGVAHVEGKTVFIDGALPGEVVEYAPYQRKPSYELAQLLKVIKPSAARVAPLCPHYGVCGGWSLQHFEGRAQVATNHRG